MRSYHAFVISVVLFVLALGAMDVLHGGWDAVAGAIMLLSTMVALLAFAVLVHQAERSSGAPE